MRVTLAPTPRSRSLWAAACGLSVIVAGVIAGAQTTPPGNDRRFGGRLPASPLMQALDADGDGELSTREIENAAAALKALDRDSDGKLSAEELRPARAGRGPTSPPPTVQQLVDRMMTFDKDGDGKLSKDELPGPMRVLLDRADVNKDGFLDRAELTVAAEQGARRNSSPGSGPGAPSRGPSQRQPPPARDTGA